MVELGLSTAFQSAEDNSLLGIGASSKRGHYPNGDGLGWRAPSQKLNVGEINRPILPRRAVIGAVHEGSNGIDWTGMISASARRTPLIWTMSHPI
jgi:hypothetical protein